MRKALLIILFVIISISTFAQNRDTTRNKVKPDIGTIIPLNEDGKIYATDSTHSPHKAVMRSLMIPGWGQVYNHHWWKAPPLYAGLGLLVSAIVFNQRNYSDFIALAKIKRTGTVPTPASPLYSLYLMHKDAYDKYFYLSEENMVTASNGFIRNRDLSILGFIGLWGINMVDAYISAKFIKSYSMDNDLSFRISPELIYQGSYTANNSLLMPSLKITVLLN